MEIVWRFDSLVECGDENAQTGLNKSMVAVGLVDIVERCVAARAGVVRFLGGHAGPR